MVTLNEQLKFESKKLKNIIPNLINKTFNKDYRNFENRSFESRPKSLGAKIPDGLLTTSLGEEKFLKEILDGKPGIVSFYRGAWCPYCNLELSALKNTASDHKEIPILLISPDSQDYTKETLNVLDENLTYLSDRNNDLAKKFNLVIKVPGLVKLMMTLFDVDIKVNTLPIPATYLVNSEGVITYAWTNPDYTKRPEPLDLLNAYKELIEYDQIDKKRIA